MISKNIKRNLMLIILLISIVSGIIITFYQQNLVKNSFKNTIETLDKNVQNSYKVILSDISKEISMKTDTILKVNGITESFFDKDRDKLYKTVIPFYKRMCEQNPYLKIMTFRLADGSTFLRVHKPEMFGDELNKKRKIIIDTNKLRKRHIGFEVGKLNMTYRIVTPIFYKNQYLGLVEVGVEPEYITNKLNKLFNIKRALLVKKENISISLDKQEHPFISDFVLVRGDKLFKNYIKQIDLNKVVTITTDEDKNYIIDNDIDLLDHQNQVTAKILLAYNIDDYLLELNSITKDIILHTFILMLILMFVLNYFINLFTKQINKLNSNLFDKSNELELMVLEKTKLSETIFYKSTDGLSILENSKFTNCNDALLKMFKYNNKNDFLNIHPSQLSPKYQPDGRDSFEKANEMMQIVIDTGSNSFEWMHTKSDGVDFWAEIVLTDISTDNKNIIHVSCRDIDNRKKSEFALEELTKTLEEKVKEELSKNREKDQQLIQQSRLAQMGEMISMIAHQWRQPLTAISATTNNLTFKLMMDDIDKKEFETEIGLIANYSQHLSKTIDDFRGFFKEEKEKEITTLNTIVQSTIDIVKVSLENKNIKLNTNLLCDKPILTYPSEIKQVVLNLINNAQDALLENKTINPTITIQIYCKEDNHILTVEDNGGGIPENIKDKIFDPYFSTKKEKDGTGLGLYMSKTIIEDHCNGKLNIKNIKNGAIFTITFQKALEGNSC